MTYYKQHSASLHSSHLAFYLERFVKVQMVQTNSSTDTLSFTCSARFTSVYVNKIFSRWVITMQRKSKYMENNF